MFSGTTCRLVTLRPWPCCGRAGSLYFSNNRRGFKLDDSLREEFLCEDITSAQRWIPTFSATRKIHCCWLNSPLWRCVIYLLKV